jgi:diaminohydroxyphosphoribosylaminopyrimidine deaminase/5-amino-6-(5-phosphoribosylamino)uracil reductase
VWAELCARAHSDGSSSCRPQEVEPSGDTMRSLFEPLLGPLPVGRPFVVAHLAQSLDGRIACLDGESHWISGPEDLTHTHRLRALCGAVMVGAETVIQDNCRLTVRRCEGPQPIRVLLDPSCRIPSDREVFTDGAAPTVLLTGPGCQAPAGVEHVVLPVGQDGFDGSEILDALYSRGVRRVFVEGGGATVARLLRAGLLDRLHLTMAPLLMGTGRSTLGVAIGEDLSSCPRPKVTVYPMGGDWLFDCDFGLSGS